MKITKTKERITEEIDVQIGTYYFECNDGNYHKMILEDYDDGEGMEFILESVEKHNNDYGVRVRKYTIFEEEELPYKFIGFILGTSGKKITKEEFDFEKQDIIKRII